MLLIRCSLNLLRREIYAKFTEISVVCDIAQDETDRCTAGLDARNFEELLQMVRSQFYYAGASMRMDVFTHWSDEAKQHVNQFYQRTMENIMLH